MINYREILFLSYEKKMGSREVAASVRCSKSAVNEFLSRFERCDRNLLSYPLGEDVTNERIREVLYKQQGNISKSAHYREPDYAAVVSAMKNKGETLKRQWRKYFSAGVVEGKEPYGYRQFCQRMADWVCDQETVSHILRNPGENMELDFAGMKLRLKSANPSEDGVEVVIFVATLSYSAYFYAEGLVCCDEENWIRVCNNALSFFGGVTPIVTPDNCKVAVNHNRDWVEPSLNETFQNWADHYHTAILPAAVRSPRWKPMVENSVGVVTRDILAEMNEMVFFSLADLNAELMRRVEERNAENFRGLDFSRRDKFLEFEKPALLPLPSEMFAVTQKRTAKVAGDLSVFFDSNHYCMTKRWVGSTVEIRASYSKVSIYTRTGTLIKTYPRCHGRHEWVYDETTAPKTASDFSYWSPDYFKAKATAIGPNTKAVVERILASRRYPNQTFRACMGVISLAKKHGVDALEAACMHALEAHRPNYTFVRDMLASSDHVVLNRQDEPAPRMRYKADDSQYSLEHLLRAQEVDG